MEHVMTNLQRRLKKLEARSAPPKPLRLVVRYEGCDWDEPEEPEAGIDENTMVVVVQYVDFPPKAPLGPTR
jgi:hypothetical protein